MCSRESGTPRVRGSSHARALTSTMTSGGKDRGTTSAGAFLEAREAFLEETFAPLADDLAARVESRRNLIVAESLGGEEHDLGPDYVSIRQRIFSGLSFETSALIAVGASSLEAAEGEGMSFSRIIGFAAVMLASVNIFGGFIVSQRMLQMFKKKK